MLPKAVGMWARRTMGGLSALTCAISIHAPEYKHLSHGVPVFVSTYARQRAYSQLCVEQVLLMGVGCGTLKRFKKAEERELATLS